MHTTRLIRNCIVLNFVSLFLVILPEFDFGMRSRLEGELDNAEGVHTEPVGDEER